MKDFSFFIGIDISADSFTAHCMNKDFNVIFPAESFENTPEGFEQLSDRIQANSIPIKRLLLCLEATGVYSETLCYVMSSNSYSIALVDPRKVKGATQDSPRKNDSLDATRITEYAARFTDKLTIWKPNNHILEQIKVLLSTREHLTQQKVSNENALKTLQRKYYQTPFANKVYEETISLFKKDIAAIDREIRRLIDKDDSFRHYISLAVSVPGVGLLLGANLLVLTQGFTEPISYKKLSAHFGICPFEKESGSSVRKKPRSRGHGPARIRKLLHLASRSVKTHRPEFRKYFYRKSLEGKPNKLILNNISNKILKIICAVINSKTAYVDNYKSVHPNILKSA